MKIVYTVWSVNYGLSRNLWKPPATGRGGFRQASVRFPDFFINKKNLKKNIVRKPAGNRHGRFPVSFRIIHHWRTTRYATLKIWKIKPIFTHHWKGNTPFLRIQFDKSNMYWISKYRCSENNDFNQSKHMLYKTGLKYEQKFEISVVRLYDVVTESKQMS